MTPSIDILYGLYTGTHNLGKQYYIGPGWGGISPASSQLGSGFGSSPNAQLHIAFGNWPSASTKSKLFRAVLSD